MAQRDDNDPEDEDEVLDDSLGLDVAGAANLDAEARWQGDAHAGIEVAPLPAAQLGALQVDHDTRVASADGSSDDTDLDELVLEGSLDIPPTWTSTPASKDSHDGSRAPAPTASPLTASRLDRLRAPGAALTIDHDVQRQGAAQRAGFGADVDLDIDVAALPARPGPTAADLDAPRQADLARTAAALPPSGADAADGSSERRRGYVAIGGKSFAQFLVVIAVAVAALTRMGTADWGLPYTLHVDERGFVVNEALVTEWRGLTRDDWRPRNTTYGPLVFELVIGVKWMLFGGANEARTRTGDYANGWDYLGAFGTTADDDPGGWSMSTLMYSLRLIVGFLGAWAVLLLAMAARRLHRGVLGWWAAAATASLAALAPGLIQVGHFYTPESLLVFEIALFLYGCACLTTGAAPLKSSILVGFSVALIAATKGPGLLLCLALPFAIARGARGGRPAETRSAAILDPLRALFSVQIWLAIGVSVAVYACMNPWLFADPSNYFAEIPDNRSGLTVLRQRFEEADYGFYDWRFSYNDTLPIWTQLGTLLPYAVGGLTTMAAAFAIVVRGYRRHAIATLGVAATLPTLLLVGFWGVKTIRYVVPMLPGILLLAGSACVLGLERRSAESAGIRAARRTGLAAGGLVVVWTALYGTAFALMFREPDPRVLAGRWLRAHAAPTDVIVVEPEPSYSAVVDDGYGVVGRLNRNADGSLRPALRAIRLFSRSPEDVPAHVDHVLREARFVVVGEWYKRRAFHPEAATRAPDHQAFYNSLYDGSRGFELAVRFDRTPTLGPLRWDEAGGDALAVCFDHMPIEIFERSR